MGRYLKIPLICLLSIVKMFVILLHTTTSFFSQHLPHFPTKPVLVTLMPTTATTKLKAGYQFEESYLIPYI